MFCEGGKSFSVENKNENQVFIYNIEKSKTGKYILSRLDSKDTILNNGKYQRTFYLKNALIEGNDLLVVNITNQKIYLSRYILENDKIKIQKDLAKVSYEMVSVDEAKEVTFKYIEDVKKAICVFDVEKKCEIFPFRYIDGKEKTINGKFKLMADKKYIVLKYGKIDSIYPVK